jgi:hypothetical protein
MTLRSGLFDQQTAPGTIVGGVDPAPVLPQVTVPAALADVLAELDSRNTQIKNLIERGQFADIYAPALQAKELALALESHRAELRPDHVRLFDSAMSGLVRDAYLLDAVGDLGNKQNVVQAYARFAAALKDIDTAFAK